MIQILGGDSHSLFLVIKDENSLSFFEYPNLGGWPWLRRTRATIIIFFNFIIWHLIYWKLSFVFFQVWCFWSNGSGHGFNKLTRIDNVFFFNFSSPLLNIDIFFLFSFLSDYPISWPSLWVSLVNLVELAPFFFLLITLSSFGSFWVVVFFFLTSPFNIWFVDNWVSWFFHIWYFWSSGPCQEFYKLMMIFLKMGFMIFFIFLSIGLPDLITWLVGLTGWPGWAQVFLWLIL